MRKTTVVSIPQKGAKVNIDEIVDDLRGQLQSLEDLKTHITESQEDIRETICRLQMLKEAAPG